MTLGERLKDARKKKNFTQMNAAKKLGVTNGALSGYERNYRDPDTDMLRKMADLYEVSTEWLLGNTDNPKRIANDSLTDKDERDISKRMEKMKKDLKEGNREGGGLNFRGEPMSEEAMESLLEALEHAERIATLANKKFAPNKYREKN